VAEIGRLTLQLDGGDEGASSPLRRKIVEALSYSKKDVLKDTVVAPNPSPMSFDQPSEHFSSAVLEDLVFEENSILKRDLSDARDDVVRSKVEAQEERIRWRVLCGIGHREKKKAFTTSTHATSPWSKRKLEMQGNIDELGAEVQLLRRAHKLSLRENDKLRAKITGLEQNVTKMTDKNAVLSHECGRLKETISQLEGRIDILKAASHEGFSTPSTVLQPL